MTEDPLVKVKSGLQKWVRIQAALFGAQIAVVFGVFYWLSTVNPSFSVLYAYGYSAVAIAGLATLLWSLSHRVVPRYLAFVRSFAGCLREAQFIPFGTRVRGLHLAFGNGLIMNAQANSLAFRLFLAPDGSVLRPALDGLPALFRSYRGAKRRGMASTRKGDARMNAELDRIRASLGSRWALVFLFEKPADRPTESSSGKWTSVGVFFTPKWTQRGDSVRSAVDDIEKLLEQARTGLALRS